MRRMERFIEARSTKEGKIISILLAFLLAFTMMNISVFAPQAYAAGEKGFAPGSVSDIQDAVNEGGSAGDYESGSVGGSDESDAENSGNNTETTNPDSSDPDFQKITDFTPIEFESNVVDNGSINAVINERTGVSSSFQPATDPDATHEWVMKDESIATVEVNEMIPDYPDIIGQTEGTTILTHILRANATAKPQTESWIIVVSKTQLPDSTLIYMDGDTVLDTTNYFEGQQVRLDQEIPVAPNENYSFAGWSQNSDGTGELLQPNQLIQMVPGGVTLYAVWAVPSNCTITVNYLDATTGEPIMESRTYGSFVLGSTVSVEPADIPGYACVAINDTNLSDTVTSVDVAITTAPFNDGTNYVNMYYTATDSDYIVEYYQQNLGDDYYTLAQTETLSAQTGTTVTAEMRTFDGFNLNTQAEGTVQSATVSGDGSTTLKLFYDRNTYTVSYSYENAPEGAADLPETATYRFGTPGISVAPAPSLEGYRFSGWVAAGNDEATTGSISPIARDYNFTGTWTPRTDMPYVINYYYMEDGMYPQTPEVVAAANGVFGESLSLSADQLAPKASETCQYVIDDAQDNMVSNVIDSENVEFAVYFKQQFTVTFAAGEGVEFAGGESSVATTCDYNDETPDAPQVVDRPGYKLVWDAPIASNVTANVTYTANWEPLQCSYKVFYRDMDGNDLIPAADGFTSAEYNQTITVSIPEIPGYESVDSAGEIKFIINSEQQECIVSYNKDMSAVQTYSFTVRYFLNGSTTPLGDPATYSVDISLWDIEPGVPVQVPTSDVDLNAFPGMVAVSYRCDGNSYAELPATVEAGSMIDVVLTRNSEGITEKTRPAIQYNGTNFDSFGYFLPGLAPVNDPSGDIALMEGEVIMYKVGDGSWTSDQAVAAEGIVEPGEYHVSVAICAEGAEPTTGDFILNTMVTVGKRVITIAAPTISKEYDGTPLVAAELTDQDSLASQFAGDDFKYLELKISGEQTAVGSSPSIVTAEWDTTVEGCDEAVLDSRYDINTYEGMLTVTPAGAATLRPQVSLEGWTYDGAFDAAATLESSLDNKAHTQADGYAYAKKLADGTFQDIAAAPVDAGTYRITANWAASPDGSQSAVSAQAEFTIEPATLTITTESKSWTYDGNRHSFEAGEGYTVDGLVPGEELLVSLTASVGPDVASVVNAYSIDWEHSTAKRDNYVISTDSKAGTISVVRASLADKVTVTSYDGIYDGAPHGISVSVNAADVVVAFPNDDNSATDVTVDGSKEVRFTVKGNNYEDYEGVGYVTIRPKALSEDGFTVTGLENIELVYNGTEQRREPAAVLDNGLGVELTSADYQVSVGNAVNAGSVAVTINGIGNYSGHITKSYTIAKAPLTVNTPSATKAYDGTPLTATDGATVSGLVNGETATVVCTGRAEVVGTPVTNTYELRWGTARAGNYEVKSSQLGTLTITPASVEVRPLNVQKVFGSTAPELRADVVGLLGNDTIDYTLSCQDGLEANAPVRDGGYTIYAQGATTQGNYQVSFSTGTLTVTPQSIEKNSDAYLGVEVTGPGSVEYTGQEQALDPVVTPAPGAPALQLGTDFTVTRSANVTDAGSVTLVVEGAGNYMGSVECGYEITPAPYYVVTQGATREYNGQPLTAGGEIFGLQNGETVNLVFTGSQTQVGSSANTYEVRWTGTAKESNYSLNSDQCVEGTLTVLKASAVNMNVVDPAPVTYNGFDQRLEPTVTDSRTGEALTRNTDYALGWSSDVRNAGQVTVTVIGMGNYSGEIPSHYTITPKAATVMANGGSKVYGDGDPSIGATVSGTVNGETVRYTVSRASGEAAGNYTVRATGATSQGNYTVAFRSNIFTIEPQSIAPADGSYRGVTVGEMESGTYTGTPYQGAPAVEDQYGATLQRGSDFTMAFSDEDGIAMNAGEHWATVRGVGNYTGEVTRGFTIDPAELSVTTESAKAVFTPESSLTAPGRIEGLVTGDNVTLSVTGEQYNAGTSTNTYSIDWGATRESNYSISEDLGTLTVVKQSINPADPTSSPADSTEPLYAGARFSFPDEALMYNGTEQRWQPLVIAGGVTEYEVEYSGDLRNVGTVDVTIRGTGNYAGEVTRSYNITPTMLRITTPSAVKTYDGTPLTSIIGTMDNLQPGDNVAMIVTGSQTQVGSSRNTYVLNWADPAIQDNYVISENLGTLTVEPAPVDPGASGNDTPTTPNGPTTFVPGAAGGAGAAGAIDALTAAAADAVPDAPTPLDEGAGDDAAAAGATIDDDANPLSGGVKDIEDDENALAGPLTPVDYVQWLMIFGLVITLVYGFVVVRRRLGYADDVNSFEDSILGIFR